MCICMLLPLRSLLTPKSSQVRLTCAQVILWMCTECIECTAQWISMRWSGGATCRWVRTSGVQVAKRGGSPRGYCLGLFWALLASFGLSWLAAPEHHYIPIRSLLPFCGSQKRLKLYTKNRKDWNFYSEKQRKRFLRFSLLKFKFSLKNSCLFWFSFIIHVHEFL